jgi:AmpD protein
MSLSQSSPLPEIRVNAAGWIEGIRHCQSPNFSARPKEVAIRLLVIHCISLPSRQFGGDAIERFFCNRLGADEHPDFASIADMCVSAHLLVRRDGECIQFVSFLDRAWHAGRSSYQGVAECNDFGIGIELEGADDVPYEPAQYQTLAAVTRSLGKRWPAIGEGAITGHSDIAPGRKTDPGPAFDWQRYRQLLADHDD